MANSEMKRAMATPVRSKIPMKQAPLTQNSGASTSLPDSGSGTQQEGQLGRLPLARKNFIYMAIAGLMIVAGFLLMLGGGSTPEQFNPDIFSTRRIVIGPTIAFLGFVFMGIAIIIKPKGEAEKSNSSATDIEK